ncbi:glycerophosphodiester phosphodiesterase [Actimicrobium sp. CCI2.3]|uniref:glycerophosphodiester phosphodiesterase n=1 Tax=Actimicrobium sp. CCI2.3 TaxID=3048616 RepID=UPI002AB578B6|nr:glycerophosphodiester phosphodiesterase [Actimicrobium sp. CCI2.3]MDY7574002.1 glycerophosphodiester phosphodiesterase [Actimicrobium sp. CCI2.3]MEB0021890.1 glycerophosphodiester phosphodiesterase [Actimicrobium sp. CCI2.3]
MKITWPFPRVVAHRGGGSLSPENTLAAMQCGLAHGFHAVEFDVMLSQDGVPILMHDEQFGRTIAGAGAVPTTNVALLTTMDAGSWFGPAFIGERVPTYRRVIQFCRRHRIWMNVEIKPAHGVEQATGTAVAAMTLAMLEADQAIPLLSSFSFEALMAAKLVAPEIPRGWLVEHIPADWKAKLLELNAVALHVDQTHLTATTAAAVTKAGFGLFCYTVNTAERARELLDWGVDGFCTDRIDLIGPDFA